MIDLSYSCFEERGIKCGVPCCTGGHEMRFTGRYSCGEEIPVSRHVWEGISRITSGTISGFEGDFRGIRNTAGFTFR
jgi:hypothetical protein